MEESLYSVMKNKNLIVNTENWFFNSLADEIMCLKKEIG